MSKLDKKLTIAMIFIWTIVGVVSHVSGYMYASSGMTVEGRLAEATGSNVYQIIELSVAVIMLGSALIVNYLIAKVMGAKIGLLGALNFGGLFITGLWAAIGYYSWGLANSHQVSNLGVFNAIGIELDQGTLAHEVFEILHGWLYWVGDLVFVGLYALPVLGWLWSVIYMNLYRNSTGRTFTDNVLDL